MDVLMKWLKYFSPAPFIEPIEDQSVVQKEYKGWRWRIFYSMFVGYMLYYFTRKSFTFSMPGLITDLGYEKADLGIVVTILSIAYGGSKFMSGLVGDRSNPRYMMGAGLILTGILNLLCGFSSSLLFFCLFMGLNGLFQGFGWPPCARLLTHWYSHSERGTWWSFWNISHNLGGALIAIIAGWALQYYGWRYGMYIPGVICIIGGLFVINRLRDTPQSLGLPSIEVYRNDFGGEEKKSSLDERELTTKEILFDFILKNSYIWLLAVAYLFIYVVREGFNNWTQLYLIQERGYTPFEASQPIVLFEVGGVLGSLFAGWFSDRFTQSRRGPVNTIFSFALFAATLLFWCVPEGYWYLDYLAVTCIGFFVFGPQMMIGLAAAELSHKKAAGTATGFIGLFAYLGAAASGYPLGKISDTWGWEGFFIAISICCFMAAILLIPTWNLSARKKGELKALES
jgi:OPA family sugar phosphate sensor protein UhpC-like MFS transporter